MTFRKNTFTCIVSSWGIHVLQSVKWTSERDHLVPLFYYIVKASSTLKSCTKFSPDLNTLAPVRPPSGFLKTL